MYALAADRRPNRAARDRLFACNDQKPPAMNRPVRSIHDIKGVSLGFPEPIRVAAPEPLCAHYLEGRGTRLVVSFSGVGRKRGVLPPPEFVGSASNYGENHVLFIADSTRSWMNGKGVAEAIAKLVAQFRNFHGITEIVAMGNSMGGFGALVLADMLPVKTVIAFAPQFSMHPDLMPEETRWAYFRDAITDWPIPDVGALNNPDTTYFMLHSAHPWEARHWRQFPTTRYQLIFKDLAHDIAARLRKRKTLAPVIAAAIEGRPRKVRKLLQRETFGRSFDVAWRDDFAAEFPEDQQATGASVEATG